MTRKFEKLTRDLAIVSSSLFLPYVIASGTYRGNLNNLDICIFPGSEPSEDVLKALLPKGVHFVSFEEAKKHNIRELHIVPQYFLFQNFNNVFDSLNFESYIPHSDGLRNGFFPLIDKNRDIAEFVQYGFELNEHTFETNYDDSTLAKKRTVIPFNFLEEAWIDLAGNNSVSEGVSDNFLQNDLLIILRHWGTSYYEFKSEFDISSVLDDLFSNHNEFDRVILRGHPWDIEGYEKAKQFLFFKSQEVGFELVLWDELKITQNIINELNNPEAMLFNNQFSKLGNLFAFDSSISWACSIKHPNLNIFWPNHKEIFKYFKFRSSAEIIFEQIEWMKDVILHGLSPASVENFDNPHLVISTDGKALVNSLSETYIRNLSNYSSARETERDQINWQLQTVLSEITEVSNQLQIALSDNELVVVQMNNLTHQRDDAISKLLKFEKSFLGKSLNLLRKVYFRLRRMFY